MLTYAIIFILSFLGVIIIVFTHWGDLRRITDEARAQDREMSFAVFMRGLSDKSRAYWHGHFKKYLFLFLEKQIRYVRISFLKAERILMNLARRLRGISDRPADTTDKQAPE